MHVLVEASTYPTRRPPSYMARLLGAVRFHNQSKSVGDANRALNFERRPGIGRSRTTQSIVDLSSMQIVPAFNVRWRCIPLFSFIGILNERGRQIEEAASCSLTW